MIQKLAWILIYLKWWSGLLMYSKYSLPQPISRSIYCSIPLFQIAKTKSLPTSQWSLLASTPSPNEQKVKGNRQRMGQTATRRNQLPLLICFQTKPPINLAWPFEILPTEHWQSISSANTFLQATRTVTVTVTLVSCYALSFSIKKSMDEVSLHEHTVVDFGWLRETVHRRCAANVVRWRDRAAHWGDEDRLWR